MGTSSSYLAATHLQLEQQFERLQRNKKQKQSYLVLCEVLHLKSPDTSYDFTVSLPLLFYLDEEYNGVISLQNAKDGWRRIVELVERQKITRNDVHQRLQHHFLVHFASAPAATIISWLLRLVLSTRPCLVLSSGMFVVREAMHDMWCLLGPLGEWAETDQQQHTDAIANYAYNHNLTFHEFFDMLQTVGEEAGLLDLDDESLDNYVPLHVFELFCHSLIHSFLSTMCSLGSISSFTSCDVPSLHDDESLPANDTMSTQHTQRDKDTTREASVESSPTAITRTVSTVITSHPSSSPPHAPSLPPTHNSAPSISLAPPLPLSLPLDRSSRSARTNRSSTHRLRDIMEEGSSSSAAAAVHNPPFIPSLSFARKTSIPDLHPSSSTRSPPGSSHMMTPHGLLTPQRRALSHSGFNTTPMMSPHHKQLLEETGRRQTHRLSAESDEEGEDAEEDEELDDEVAEEPDDDDVDDAVEDDLAKLPNVPEEKTPFSPSYSHAHITSSSPIVTTPTVKNHHHVTPIDDDLITPSRQPLSLPPASLSPTPPHPFGATNSPTLAEKYEKNITQQVNGNKEKEKGKKQADVHSGVKLKDTTKSKALQKSSSTPTIKPSSHSAKVATIKSPTNATKKPSKMFITKQANIKSK